MDVILAITITDGKLISYAEQHANVHKREFLDGHPIYHATIAKQG